MRQTIRFVITAVVVTIALGILAIRNSNNRKNLVYNENLDLAVAAVDGDELLLSDMAFYIAYEEDLVEAHAVLYDEEDTGAFWRLAVSNQSFMGVMAKDNIMDMAIHDTIFYKLAQADGIELTDEEAEYVESVQADFWDDLEDEQKEALGVGKDVLDETMRRLALAEKYQTVLAYMEEKEFDDYSFNGDAYKALLEEEHEYEIYEDVWDRIKIGSITIDH